MIMQMLVSALNHLFFFFCSILKRLFEKENEERVPMVDGNQKGGSTSQQMPGRPHRPITRQESTLSRGFKVFFLFLLFLEPLKKSDFKSVFLEKRRRFHSLFLY